MAPPTLALDIGGTKIAAGLVDARRSAVRTTASCRRLTATPRRCGPSSTQLVTEALAAGRGGVRRRHLLGGPDPSADGTISPINIAAWRGFPIVDRVATMLPGVPVRLGGDGLCMALGEHWRGAGRGAQFMLGMVVSTGVGGGLVLDGAPVRRRTGNAGPRRPRRRRPRRRRRAPAVAAAASRPSRPVRTWRAGLASTAGSGPDADAKELAEAADAGDAVALRAFRRGGDGGRGDDRVGRRGLRPRPGGRSAAGWPSPARCCSTRCARRWRSYAGLDFIRGLRVVPAELGGDAGLVGAAALLARDLSRLGAAAPHFALRNPGVR